MLDTLLSFVAPHLCCGCGSIGSLLCDNCKYDINQEPYDGCLICKRPTVAGICSSHRVVYNQAWCVGERKDVLQRLIGNYKFQNTKAANLVLADLLDEMLPELPPGTIIVPIPTASSHIRERGYDHMWLVAQRLAKKRGLPIEPVIARVSNATQHHVGRSQRIAQALAAFHVPHSVSQSAHYLLIDDIVTTGATIEAATRLLQKAGASSIWVAAIARQPLD